ncbi:MAG: Ig-like domain-containing protein, partial [Prolixibacteraceae bacterium]|nr:Ig-like domain-containing protein [Prolixibacteraceae bacterium]
MSKAPFILYMNKARNIEKTPILIVLVFIWIIIISSCANQGMPAGGPRDSLPPVITSTYPELKALNHTENEVRITFNEFIIPDLVPDKLVVSPPLEKRPTILTKSKTLIIRFNEELKENATYSLDFKNSVVDNNEKNPYKNLRFSFSTGNSYDSLRVAGMVLNAFTLEPLDNSLVMLHKNLHDSAVYTTRPDYIARTGEDGMFLIDNVAEGTYNIISINDDNNDLIYNEGAEQIAFHDTLIVPSAEYHAEPDTLVKGLDSLLIEGHVQFYPDPVFLNQFTEDLYIQYLKNFRRDSRYQCTFVFNESVEDSLEIRLLNSDKTDWYLPEPNQNYDSLTIWLADTTIAGTDTLSVELSYLQIDSTKMIFLEKDTLDLIFTDRKEDPKQSRRARRDKDEEPGEVEQFDWTNNIKSSDFNLNEDIILTAPQPVKTFNKESISLYLTEDTLKSPLNFNFFKDTLIHRTYRISFPWEESMNYTIEIDSAACGNIYGITSRKLLQMFKTRSKDYYGTIKLNFTNVEDSIIIQLFKSINEEEIIKQKIINENQSVFFNYLSPDKYIIKIIYDSNGNGKWDPGSY